VVNSKNQNSYFGLIVKALRNGAADFTLRNAEHSRNTTEKQTLSEVNAEHSRTPLRENKNSVSTKEQEEKKRIFRNPLIIKIMPSG